MIYKVFYQETKTEVPTREHTQSLYIDAESVTEVRRILDEKNPYHVEHIQLLDDAHLAYEQKSDRFELTEFAD